MRDVVSRDLDIDKYRHRAKLQHRIDRSRKPGRNADDLITRFNRAVAQSGLGQC
jgi:hypothetical protein